MQIALDLTSDLMEIAKRNLTPEFKTIITTNFKDDQKEDENFLTLKKALLGDSKALIIQVNEDHRVKSKCKNYIVFYLILVERIEHYYVLA